MSAFTRLLVLALAMCGALALPAAAEDEQSSRRFGNDLFVAGEDVRVAEAGLEDVFAAAQTVTVSGNVGESIHAVGRRIRFEGSAGRDVYAAGREVEIRGPVTGDVAAFAERVELAGSAGADVVLGGREVEVSGPVGGDATLFGEEVEIAAPITGSVQVRAGRIRFGPGARIDGTLEYWSPDPVTVPASVMPPDRVRGVRTERHEDEDDSPVDRGVAFGVGVLIMLALAGLFSALLPGRIAQAHERAVDRPWLNLLMGVIAVSALFGSVLVLAVSIIGLPLVPVIVLLAPVVLLAAYLTAAFTVGRLSLGLARVRPIEGRLGVFTAMATGVVLLAVLRLIPILGWIVLVLAVMVGLGAWFSLFVRRRPAGA